VTPYTVRQTDRVKDCHLCGSPYPVEELVDEEDGFQFEQVSDHDCSFALRCGVELDSGRRCHLYRTFADGRCHHHTTDPSAKVRRVRPKPKPKPPIAGPLGPWPVLPEEIAALPVSQAVSMRYACFLLGGLTRDANAD